MQDEPTPHEIMGAVAEFLRAVVAIEANPRTAFVARVAANALEMSRRQLALAPAADAAEHERLRAILGQDGSLGELNAEFAGRIASGALELDSPGVSEQLWAATLAKLAVDQPTYSGYRAALDERAEPGV
jgi:Domain of unknown function (DUF6285)